VTPRTAPDAPVAVSLTPLALETDSRSFRIAQGLAELGYRSIVIEGKASTRHFWDEAIEVRSLDPQPGPAAAPAGGGGRGGVVTALREGRGGAPGEALLYAGFRGHHWLRFGHKARRLVPPAALYYLHSFEFYDAVAPLAARGGARVIYDAHDFYRGIDPAAAQRPFDRNWLRPFFNRQEDRLLANADAVVTVSEGVAGLFEELCGRRPAVIRNCHEDRQDTPPKADLREKLGLSEADRLCVVVGNYKAGMTVQAAIEALALLSDEFHLAFLGRGYEKLAALSRPAEIARRLHFGHVVAPSEVVPTIRSADIGLVIYEPYSENYRYALPNGFFQVVAAGLPLVRGYLPEIEETIGGAEIGECLARLDAASLAGAIKSCAGNAATLRANVAELARALRWENELQRLRRLIDSLPAGGTRG
jgi:glycosyltransferase involved in cell wall biosynthesis